MKLDPTKFNQLVWSTSFSPMGNNLLEEGKYGKRVCQPFFPLFSRRQTGEEGVALEAGSYLVDPDIDTVGKQKQSKRTIFQSSNVRRENFSNELLSGFNVMASDMMTSIYISDASSLLNIVSLPEIT